MPAKEIFANVEAVLKEKFLAIKHLGIFPGTSKARRGLAHETHTLLGTNPRSHQLILVYWYQEFQILRFVAAIPISKLIRTRIQGSTIHVICGNESMSRFLEAAVREKSKHDASAADSQLCTDLVLAIEENVKYYGHIRSESGDKATEAIEISIGTGNDWVRNNMKGGGDWEELYGDGFSESKPLNGKETVLRLFKGKYFD